MSDIVKQLLLQLILILLNAFFAATEIAVISLNEKKVKAQAEEGDKKAIKMLKMIEQPTGFLSTIQVGITLAGFLGSAFAADSFAQYLSDFLARTFSVSAESLGAINTISVVLITLILSYFTLVLGELVPKRIAMRHKEKWAHKVCGIISALATLLKPVVWFLSASTNGVLRLFGIDPNAKEETVSEEDIVLMLDAGADEGALDHDDITYIKNVFKLDRLTAAEIMTPRRAVTALSDDADEATIISTIDETGFSRIPVYTNTVDKVIGVLHAREYLLKHKNTDFKLEQVLYTPLFVPESVHLDLLFKDMQKNRAHMAIIINEYGETAGVVTMEDILEELVGEIWDEGEESVEPITAIGDNIYRVLCNTPLDDFLEFFSLEADEESEATTVNGWLTERSGNIPQEGDVFDWDDLLVAVVKADRLMTEEIEVQIKEKPQETDEKE